MCITVKETYIETILAVMNKNWKQYVGNLKDCYVSRFSLHFIRAPAASCVLYNRAEHSQGFSVICSSQNIPEHSGSLQHNYFGSIKSLRRDLRASSMTVDMSAL